MRMVISLTNGSIDMDWPNKEGELIVNLFLTPKRGSLHANLIAKIFLNCASFWILKFQIDFGGLFAINEFGELFHVRERRSASKDGTLLRGLLDFVKKKAHYKMGLTPLQNELLLGNISL